LRKGKFIKFGWYDSDREIDFLLYDILEDRLVGVVEKTDLQQTKYLDKVEIPLDKIKHMKAKRPFFPGTLALSSISILAILAAFTMAVIIIQSF
jgi:hypothetical protein